ncbi:MAG: hypothetical protein ABUL44_00990, partial [Flavobacterium sp.]
YAFSHLVNWKNAPPDLVRFNKLLRASDYSDDKEDEKMEQYFLSQVSFIVISNYISLEIYKYLTFLIAHEAYHAWFAPGDPGPEREKEADNFATYIYLELFSDAKFQAIGDLQESLLKKYQSLTTSSGQSDNGDVKIPNIFSAFLGKPVYDIFKQLYQHTEFYDTPADIFHLAIKDRQDNMKSLSQVSTKQLLIDLNKYFTKKLNH